MTHTEALKFIEKLPLFSATAPSLLQHALSSEHAHLLQLAPGDYAEERYLEMLGIVLEGSLQIRSADTERSLLLRVAHNGHVFGAASLFSEERSPVSRLVAQSECTLLFLKRDAVRELLRADHAFMDAYLRFLAERVQFLNAKIRCFTAGSAERRLVLWLSEHAEGEPFPTGSLTALAKTLDIGRASLYRALDKLENDGLILRNGRKITVPSIEKLLKQY